MIKRIVACVFAVLTLTALAEMEILLFLPEVHTPPEESFQRLPHDHTFYWTTMSESTNWYHSLMKNEVLVRTNGVEMFEWVYPIDTNKTMREYFSSQKDFDLRRGVMDLIWDVEGTNALPFFASVITSPGWHLCDRYRAYIRMSDVPRYWEDEPRHGMTTNEVVAIRETIESVMQAETNWSCRKKILGLLIQLFQNHQISCGN